MKLIKFIGKKTEDNDSFHAKPPFKDKIKMHVYNFDGEGVTVIPMSFLKTALTKALMQGKPFTHIHAIDGETGTLKKIEINGTDIMTVSIEKNTILSYVHYVKDEENPDKLKYEYEEFKPIQVTDYPEDDGVPYVACDIFFGDFLDTLINIIYHKMDNIGHEEIIGLGDFIVIKMPDDDTPPFYDHFWYEHAMAPIHDNHLIPVVNDKDETYYIDTTL